MIHFSFSLIKMKTHSPCIPSHHFLVHFLLILSNLSHSLLNALLGPRAATSTDRQTDRQSEIGLSSHAFFIIVFSFVFLLTHRLPIMAVFMSALSSLTLYTFPSFSRSFPSHFVQSLSLSSQCSTRTKSSNKHRLRE